ncbi:hypothetical protein J437_LFUL005000 [Ladona fulva]|uniref:Ig-like domain-containing protein n=1 Tax=Ladona fulva TaxID=123851 RepID=A0A8K0P2H6_LADFU|nr:hypothetical protein J437_LFUL005000 [Ladona fulva]
MDCAARGGFVVLWRRGSSVLTASSIMVTRDPRIRLVDGYNLEVHQVVPQDAGDYVCQISSTDPIDQVHTVEILAHARTGLFVYVMRGSAELGAGFSYRVADQFC